jgi:outer membrane protein OmpA-like peptidoglycan-associated protein
LIIESIEAEFANGLGDGSFTGRQVPAPFGKLLPGAPGWGLDLGLLYEYGGTEGQPYRWRAGLAITDLGAINIPRSDDLATLSGATNALYLPDLAPYVRYDSIAEANVSSTIDREAFELLMPLAVTLHGDARLRPQWCVSWTARMGLYGPTRRNAFRPPTQVTITPRWERKWLAAGLPITIDQANQFAMGMVLRLGPLTLGSGNVLGIFLTDNVRGGDFFAVLHVPIPYQGQPPLPEEEDPSPPVEPDPPVATLDSTTVDSSLLAATAVPDTAAASSPLPPLSFLPQRPAPPLAPPPSAPVVLARPVPITPVKATLFTPEELAELAEVPPMIEPAPRAAPSEPLTEAQIAAIEQAEADARKAARAARAQGNLPGQPASKQAPARSRRNTGQPFNDTVRTDYNSGPFAQYMPYADPDGDGVPNVDDACPDTPGLVSRRGCPADDQRGLPASARLPAGLEIDAYERVYFDVGEAYLDGKARIALNRVAEFLRAHPQVSLRIVGHADAIGTNPSNDRLSQRRCEAVRGYLQAQRLAPTRLVIEAYGERMPAADNATAEGRQRNRRVSLVLFDPE